MCIAILNYISVTLSHSLFHHSTIGVFPFSTPTPGGGGIFACSLMIITITSVYNANDDPFRVFIKVIGRKKCSLNMVHKGTIKLHQTNKFSLTTIQVLIVNQNSPVVGYMRLIVDSTTFGKELITNITNEY